MQVVGAHGMGKSHLMAAVGVTLEVEAVGSVVCPLFVGSSAGSRDTRLLLVALVRMLLQVLFIAIKYALAGTRAHANCCIWSFFFLLSPRALLLQVCMRTPAGTLVLLEITQRTNSSKQYI
jgi:hypothetical protein